VEQHVKVLAILYLVFSALGLVAAIACLVIFGGIAGIVGLAAHQDPDARIAVPVLGLIGTALFFFLVVVSVPGLVAGWGLFQWRSWARILTIVLSGLNLLNMPFGTALGVYGLWVLLNRDVEALFASGRPAA
jgi:hypothetical protein